MRRIGQTSFQRAVSWPACVAVMLCVVGCCAVETPAGGEGAVRQHDEAIEPYIAFLHEQETGPVDYVLGLFENNDVVILCERAHPEVTQWDLIYAITSDPRFIRDVGVVYTEYGAATMQARLDELMASPDLAPDEVDARLIHIMRNWSFWPVWANQNFFDYLKKLHELNATLPAEQKVRLYFSDIPMDWEVMTKQELDEAWRTLVWNRDVLIAQRIFDQQRRLVESGARRKCLVILNYRHAFRPVRNEQGEFANNVGTYLFQAFPGRVANVLINTVRPVDATDEFHAAFDLIHDGKWDAAFEAAGNPARGFDLAGSPFGADTFDLFPFDKTIAALKYQDVFTGFVFYKALSDQKSVVGVRGLLDEAFVKLVRQRCHLSAGTGFADRFAVFLGTFEYDVKTAAEQGIALEDYVRAETGTDSIPDCREKIEQWLDARAEKR
ncbi:MAG: hypothetical protein JW889_10960 [Verrucomicrobia bacterium]|nr:hypothetical protein [Verrucomicrobiota bacterium]